MKSTKSEVFQIRLSTEEKAQIQRQASEIGLSMGRYLVMLALQASKPNGSTPRPNDN